MTEWSPAHDPLIERAEMLCRLHGETGRLLQHVGDALWYVCAGRFSEAHWELRWSGLCKTVPDEPADTPFRRRPKPRPGQLAMWESGQ